MERQSLPTGENKHQYQSAQWSRLLHRKYLADAPPNQAFPIVNDSYRPLPHLNLNSSRLSSHLFTSGQLAHISHYHHLKSTNQITRLVSSPLPPLLTTHYIQAVSAPLSGINKKPTGKYQKESIREGHGNKGSSCSKSGGRLLIAEMETAAKISKKKLAVPNSSQQPTVRVQTFSPDMPLNHQSNSVPSTPHQHLRNFSLDSREPSPGATNGHSPRSAFSESNIILPSTRFVPRSGGCRYETALANIKRRMPYSIGSDKLESLNPSSIKSSLSSEEEKILSTDMKDLYQKLLPSPECELRRTKLVRKLEKLFNDKWPGHNILVHVFGSSGNCLYTDHSDVDLCITTDKKEMEGVCIIADLLAKSGMEKVICVSTAKVPIVKIWDPDLCLACDVNVNNTLALENTRMIKTYVQIDERVRPLAMIIKYWTKRRIVNDAAFGGTLSSYTWICMIINFLQSRKPPILPALHQQANIKQSKKNEGSSFADDIETLRNFGYENKETLGELLFSFFRYYAHEFDYDTYAVSVRQGKQISKVEKGWHLTNNNRLCVEEPFNTGRNLGNTADDTSFRGLHIELRRAFDLISQAKLQECCEQWNFPPEEERRIREPATKSKIIVRTASINRGGRGGTQRANRHSSYQYRHNSGINRRASSGTFEGNPFLTGYPAQNLLSQDPWLQRQAGQAQFNNDLCTTFPALQLNESNIRYHLYANGLQVQALTQSQAQIQPHSTRIIKPSTSEQSQTSHHEQLPPYTTPIRSELYYYPSQYPGNPTHQYQNSNKTPQSPSSSTAFSEASRSGHCPAITSVTRHTDPLISSRIRSHPQPATRSGQQQVLLNGAGITAPNTIIDRVYPYQENSMSTLNFIAHDIPESVNLPANIPVEKPAPMEYVGYYIRERFPSSMARGTEMPIIIPSYGDMAQQRRRHSIDQTSQYYQNSTGNTSRSPSPHLNDQIHPVAIRPAFVTEGLPAQGIPSGNLIAISSHLSHDTGNSNPTPVSIPSWQACVNEASIYDDLAHEAKAGSRDIKNHIPYVSTEIMPNFEIPEREVPDGTCRWIPNEKTINVNGSTTMHVNGNESTATISSSSSSLPISLPNSLNTTSKYQQFSDAINGYHKRPVDHSRCKLSGFNHDNITNLTDIREFPLDDVIPILSPVYEVSNKSSEGNQKLNACMEVKEKNTNNSKLGDRKAINYNPSRSLVAGNSNHSIVSKRHTQGSKSDADGLGSWHQVPRGKKKNPGSVSKASTGIRGLNEKLPKNISERKGG
ncbi:hypothetical protein EPUL_002575 [Erysiphe pulchra]|uniref:polynucleotide adenylyltransferase n=1 Tax=Erysiphe pulchra TaxID=225359 RepID=A0A2S4Q1P8_9PEZI|nr:hypothetical protein EPUL_002575 [Erysiphe pulchra]